MIVAAAVLACGQPAPHPPAPVVATPAPTRPEKRPVVRSEKHAAVAAMLTRGSVVVWFDTRRAGVVVPPRHQGDARMELRVTADARVDERGITRTLHAYGRESRVTIPWPAVYSAVAADGQQTSWRGDFPSDLVDNAITDGVWEPTSRPKNEVVADMMAIRQVPIHLDARRPGVVVPAALRTERDLVLRIGRDLTPPIPDLTVDDFGVTGTLAFAGKGFFVRVPWAALFAVVIEGYGPGLTWPGDFPPDLTP